MSNGPTTFSTAPGSVTQTTSYNERDRRDGPLVCPLPRSASYTPLLPDENISSIPREKRITRRSFSENVLPQIDTECSVERGPNLLASFIQRDPVICKFSNTTLSGFAIAPEDAADDATYRSQAMKVSETPGRQPDRQKVRRSISGSISKIARRSWISASHSPFPSPSKDLPRQDRRAGLDTLGSPTRPLGDHNAKSSNNQHDESSIPILNDTSSKNILQGGRLRRPLSALLSRNAETQTPLLPNTPKSLSAEKLPSLDYKYSPFGVPAVPRTSSIERFHNSSADTSRKKDELWSAFRNLDGEFHKTYSDHASTLNLRPEDLDRRTVILNKWWTGLLEMLNGRNGESVSGNDRPAVLEAVTALMVRGEWTTHASRTGNTTKASLKSSRSTTSLGSNMSDFLVDSVFHNVKNTFTQNLLAQMAYVVDKMSTRNVAASVVSFCGKATAYAFFYCEGVAEILVRLWNIPMETLRRIVLECTMQRFGHTPGRVSEKLFAAFPVCLQPLSFKGVRQMMKYLRSRPHLSIAMTYIPWHGPWVGRWAGRDSDLFFVFVKFYTDLACRLLPETISREEMIAAPGWALIQAQLLVVLDGTLRRSNNQFPTDQLRGPGMSSFDEMLGEANAAATMLTVPAKGSHRPMAENRLIMLLRDCLSGSNNLSDKVQRFFAESFDTISKAAARGTSIFDHNACFTLCDFLEEALAILNRYHQASGSYIKSDWQFWFDVYRRLLESHNSMTEIRLFAFIFSIWGIITNDAEMTRDICLNWLLNAETFQRQFNHWCPMEHAERLGLSKPSTAPSSPAPNRCLLIVRDDVQPAHSGMFLSFEGILSTTGMSKVNPYENHSSRNLLSKEYFPRSQSTSGDSRYPAVSGKRRWGLVKSIMPFTIHLEGALSQSQKPTSKNEPKNTVNCDVDDWPLPDTASEEPSARSTVDGSAADDPPISHRASSFKFSLEWIDKDDNSAWKDRQLYPPELPLPAQLSRQHRPDCPLELVPRKPEGAAVGPSKYAGRALAEWAGLIIECKNFFERRKAEGVPFYQMVETPLLGADPFRKG
ncbi:MAG: hypothetical protein Q9163_005542 [Psora crenata]